MAFDAGTIIAHLDIDLQHAKAKLDEFEHDVDRVGRDRKIKIGAVFDNSDMNKARKFFADLDNAISRDAATRMKSNPNGSILGSLNALLSPHQIAGAPTPTQSARSGMLGRVVIAQAVDPATRKAAQDAATAAADAVAQGASREAVNKAAADTASELRRRRFSFGNLFGGGGGGGGGGFGGSLLRAIALGGIGQFGGTGGNFAGNLAGGIGPGILGLSMRNAGILGLGGGLLGAIPGLLAPLAGLGIGVAGVGVGAKILSRALSSSNISQWAQQYQAAQNALAAAQTPQQVKAAQQQMAGAVAGARSTGGAGFAAFNALNSLQNSWQKFTAGFLPTAAKILGGVARLFQSLEPILQTFFGNAVKLLQPFLAGIGDLAKMVLPALGQAFKVVGPLLRPMLDGFGMLVKGIFPGLTLLLKDALPSVKVFAQILGTLGHDLGTMFGVMAPVLRSSSVILKALLDLLGAIFPLIGHLAAIFASALAPAFAAFASAVRAVLPVIKIIGTVLGELAGAILGDLSAAFGAIAKLLVYISPALNQLAKALGQVFKVLENSGVFAILGNALEATVKPLGKLIDAVLHGLTPILPVVTQLISSLSTTLINLLVTAIQTLVPIAIQLVNDAIKPLLPVVKALVPFISALGKALGSDLGAVIRWLAPILRTMAPWILAIVAAIKAWAIIQGILNIALDANPIGLIALAIAGLIVGITLLVTHWKQVWTDVKHWAEDAWKFLTHGWGQWLVPGITLIRLAVSYLRDHWKSIWNDIKVAATDFVNFFENNLVHPIETLAGDLYRYLWTDFGAKIYSFLVNTVPRWFSMAVNGIGRAWNVIEGVIKAPIKWVIDNVIDGLISAFDWISGKVGGPNITPIHPFGLSSGGRIPGYGGGDVVPALLEPGEAVVDKSTTRAFAGVLGMMGVPGFQGGGIIGKILGGFGDTAKILAALATGNSVALAHAIEHMIGGGVGGAAGDLAALLLRIPETLIGDAVKFLMGQFGGGGGVSGNVSSYRGLILRVLAMLGQPAGDLGIVEAQMTTESGGNPRIVNKWDSNWLAGHPSVGLMQVIQGTFDAFAGPFRNTGPFLYGVSTNPLANIYAGLNYAIHRYGAGWTSVLGHGHGYDNGGWMQPGLSWNLTGGREAVLTPVQSEAFLSLAEAAQQLSKMGGQASSMVRDVYLMLPEGTSVAQALNELDFQLKVTRMQGSMP